MIMRDVGYGWALRYTHANVASFFFIFVYAHIARGLYYNSYKSPRVAPWSIGVIILVLMIATAFLGYTIDNSPKLYKIIKFILNFPDFLFNSLITNKITNTNSNTNSNTVNCIRYYSMNHNSPSDLTDIEELFKYININPVLHFDNLHLHSVRQEIYNKVKGLSGIYIIINKINRNYYIGSASTNRFYSRFSNHLIYYRGNKILKHSVQTNGLNNFVFAILELFPYEVNKENNKDLLYLETSYLQKYAPYYNILPEAGNSFGYKHTELTKTNMKLNYSEDRKNILRETQLNRKGKWSKESIERVQISALNRSKDYLTEEGRMKISSARSINIKIYTLDNNYVCEFKNTDTAAHYLCCSPKTIRRALDMGFICIPSQFTEFLNNDHIEKHNSIIEYVNVVKDDSTILFEGVESKPKLHLKLKSGLVLLENKVRYFIKQA